MNGKRENSRRIDIRLIGGLLDLIWRNKKQFIVIYSMTLVVFLVAAFITDRFGVPVGFGWLVFGGVGIFLYNRR